LTTGRIQDDHELGDRNDRQHGVRVDADGRPGEGRSNVSGHPVLTSIAK
jgi:hypothetical protein